MNHPPLAVVVLTALLTFLCPFEGHAQRKLATRFHGFVVSGWGGGAAFTDLQRAPVTDRSTGSRVQRLMADASPSLGGAIAYWPSPAWGVRIQSGVAFTRYSLLVPPPDDEAPVDSSGPDLRIWSHDVSVLVRAPVTPGGRVMPYGVIGGGVLHYQGGERPSVAPFDPVRSALRPAAVLGLGAMVPLEQGGTGLTFEVLDHIARTPIAAPGGGEPVTGHVRWANHLRLTVGISVLLGG